MSWSQVRREENKGSLSLFSTWSLSIYVTVFSKHLPDCPGQEEAPNGTKEKRLKGSGGLWRLCHSTQECVRALKASSVSVSVSCQLMHHLMERLWLKNNNDNFIKLPQLWVALFINFMILRSYAHLLI